MRAASHEVTLRQPTAQELYAHAPPRSSVALAIRLAAFQPGTVSASFVTVSSERLFFVRRTPRACHGACDHLRPGRLRASHAVCLGYSTLEPALCARKEESDIESLSTIGSILAESLDMRGNFFDIRTILFGFYATSRHCIPRLSPRNFNLNESTANNGAAENCSARHGSCYSTFGSLSFEPPSFVARMRFLRSTLAATAPASAVAELESLVASTSPV